MPFTAIAAMGQVHNHPSYNSWRGMKERCFYPRNRKFPEYGGRGIAVCDKWRKSFRAFVDDMGVRPSEGHSIERIDTNGNYEPGNCRWATRPEQTHNQRKRLGCKSKYRGVTQVRPTGRWRAKVGNRTLGWFEAEIEAAMAYDAAAREVFGEFAKVNFPAECPAA